MPDGVVSRWFQPQSRAGNTARTIALYHHRVWSWSVYLGLAYNPPFPSTPSENFTLPTLRSKQRWRNDTGQISYQKKRKRIFTFSIFPLFSSTVIFLAINYFILCLRFFSNSRAQFEGTVYATFNFFHHLTFTRPSFGLGRGRVIINVQVELGQANNLRVKGTGGDRERR